MEIFQEGLSVTAIGMVVVFSGLVILIACIRLLALISRGEKREKRVSAAPEPPVAALAPDAPVQDDTLIAILTAAVAACMSAELGENAGFVVRRVRRVATHDSRALAARDEQMYSRR